MFFDAFIDHPGVAASVQSILACFRMAEYGDPSRQCDLFDDFCEPDCHLASLFEKRNEAVSGKPWVIQAGDASSDAMLAAHVLRTVFAGLPVMQVVQHMLTFAKYGWSGVEIDWEERQIEGRTWIVPAWFTIVRARRFRIATVNGFDPTGVDDLRLYTTPQRPRGDVLTPGKWIIIRRDPGVPLACSGLMRSCVWPALGKRYGFRDWMVLAQRFGLPKPIASYDELADETAKDIAAEIVAQIGSDIGAVKPKSIDIDFQNAVTADNSKVHGGLIGHANAEMSKRVNGSTLANDNTDSGGASYALGEVHDSVRWEAVQYDGGRVEEAFDLQVFARFCHYNGLAVAPPKIKIQLVRALEPKVWVEVAAKAKNELGIPVSKAQSREVLGLREPTDAADDLPGAPPAPPARAA